MLIFSELKAAVGNLIERPDSAFAPKIEEFINARWRHICSLRPWLALLRQITINTTPGRDYIITPQEVDQIIDIHQRETPTILALQRYYSLLHRNISSITQSDLPITAIPMGEVGVLSPLPSSGTISVESSSASDTTQTIRIKGYSENERLPIEESLTLNGTTPVISSKAYSSAEGYEPRFTKDGNTNGIVTIKRSTTTISQIAPLEKESRYKKWKLWPIPHKALTLYITYKKRTYKLVNPEDTPEMECDNALIIGAFAMALEEKRQMSKAARVWGIVDANGQYPPGTYMAEIEALIAKEPNFGENFQDQFIPLIQREAIDMPPGTIGLQLRENK